MQPSADDVTTMTPPAPHQEAIGNCWVFATNAWIETLSGRTTGSTPVDLSEAFVSYIWWFEQIVAPPPPRTRPSSSPSKCSARGAPRRTS